MPSNKKANLQAAANLNTSAAAQDLPPSYETTVLPIPRPSAGTTSAPSIPISIPSQNPLEALSRLTTIDFAKYRVPDSTLSDDCTTVTTSRPELTGTQYALIKFIYEQAALPPKPLMVVRGTHTENTSTTAIVDFELKINLTSLLDTDRDRGAGLDGTRSSKRIRVKPFQNASSSSSSSPKQPGSSRTERETTLGPLEQWVKKFCEDKAENKSFTIHRVAKNLPTSMLEGMVRTLIAATRYRGTVAVEFPVQYADVTVRRQSGNWFVNMLRLYRFTRYEVVESRWDLAGLSSQTAGAGGSAFAPGAATTEQTRRAGLIAQEWWREWEPAISNAVLARKQGWITIEDWIEARMGVREKERNRD
ncbi:hypothetical protein A1O3_01374 [Capronia epimyces CBS 606.96]|uniref:Uncharacterized protein n=1 Tax=Capronia epimyces CBS 606.96 TaxID=1182542 RepID=W9YT14_9EURO|nr:uncharacterized protein A1O3_01374 [Capronia epimyces CBS 606.96]EXJ92820.1 hypothetical protein A1O3_01374 [Capronia epimyces CBS 606.96]